MAAFAGVMGGTGAALAEYFQTSYPGRNATRATAATTVFVEGVADRFRQVHAPDGASWYIVADGRLDGRDHLAGVLGLPVTAGCEALLAAAFSRWGADFPAQIAGTYAFMAWKPADDAILLARDAVGGLPLFYHHGPAGFAFATDLPALLALPMVSKRLRLEMIAGLLGGPAYLTTSGSIYEDVDLLPAGHMLRLEAGTISVHGWWRPPPVQVREHPAAELRHLVTMAVEERLRDGRHCAVLLSGGLDSSAIACLAARRLRQDGRRLLAISSVLPEDWSGPDTDERRHVETVLAQEDNIDIHWVREGVETQPFGALSQYFDLLQYPPYSNATHMETALASAAGGHGVDTILSGFGGDFFASASLSPFPLSLLCDGEWRLALRELMAMRRGRAGWSRLLRQELLNPLRRAYQPRLRQPEIAGRRLRSVLPWPPRLLGQDVPIVATIRRRMAFLLEPGRIELTLNNMTQIFAKAFGQTLLHPLLDRRIVDFMLSLPAGQIRQDGVPRYLFREAMTGILPDSIRLRPDKGPAFDPMLASRMAAACQDLAAWAEATADHPSWDIVNRQAFLNELSLIRPGTRETWRQTMFTTVMQGGMTARFIQWHQQTMEAP